MADAEYRRLTCGACNTGFTQLPKGRPAKTCEPCRSTPERNCARCDSKLPKGHAKWCSTRCKDGTKLTREEYRESVKTGAKGWFTCRCCGSEAYRAISGTNAKKGLANSFCSMSCRVSHMAKVRTEVESIRKMGKTCVANHRAKLSGISALARVLEKVKRIKSKACTACLICGGPCGGGKTKPRKYCSKACFRKTESHAISSRKSKARRRAVERGCKEARAIDPIAVFDRDGWRCQICLQPTPKKLRGTYKDKAPELDHIVPIAKGGLHVWDNLQCTCRSCNAAKSDKAPAGRMGLFTSLMQ